MGVGMGFGMGNALGQTVGGAVGNTMQSIPQPPQSSFYVAKNGQTVGPFTVDAIQGMIAQGEVTRDTYVYKVGGSAWTSAANAGELAHLFPMMPPPPPVK